MSEQKKFIFEGKTEDDEVEQPDGSYEWEYTLHDADGYSIPGKIQNLLNDIFYTEPVGNKKVRVTVEIVEE